MNKIEKKSACCHDAFILEDHPDSFSQQIFIEQSGLCTVLRWVVKKNVHGHCPQAPYNLEGRQRISI